MSPAAGVATWAADVLLVAGLSGSRTGSRVGVAASVILLPVAAFVDGPPVVRALLAVGFVVCLLKMLELRRQWPFGGFLARLAHVVALFDTRRGERRAPGIDIAASAGLAVAGTLFLAALAAVRSAGALPDAPRYAVRWLAGSVMCFAGFEAVVASVRAAAAMSGVRPPSLHDRPYLSRSVAEFWGRRWNRVVSAMLRDQCFEPLARRSRAAALLAVFGASAAIHAYTAGVALGGLAAASWAAFFLAQPALIAAERGLGARRWPAFAGRAWTVAALAVVAPLFLEPFLRLFE